MLEEIVATNKVDICCLQEVKTKYFTADEANKEGNYMFNFNTEEKYLTNLSVKMRKCQKVSQWGTGKGIRKREKKEWRFLETNSHRFAGVVWDEKILIITVYLPFNHNNKKDDEKLRDVIEEILLFCCRI